MEHVCSKYRHLLLGILGKVMIVVNANWAALKNHRNVRPLVVRKAGLFPEAAVEVCGF